MGIINRSARCPANQSVVESYRGFDYLGRALASKGFMVTSVDPLLLNNANGTADDPNLNSARGRLVLRTIEKIRLWAASSEESLQALGFDISHNVDFSRIGFLGHSRGGAGVRLAYNMLMTPEKIPAEVKDWSSLGSKVAAVFEVAPYYSAEGKESYVVGVPWVLMAAGCESDEVDYG